MTASEFISAVIVVAALLSLAMSGAWLIWRRTGNSGWIDTTWTFAVGLVGIAGALAPVVLLGLLSPRQAMVVLLVGAWTLRLGLHIASRSAGISDDPRYARLAQEWGSDAPRQMFLLVQKQALVSIPLSLSIVLAGWNPAGLRLQDLLGAAVLAIGIAGEALADVQLRRFRQEADGSRVCDVGLWRWSRHPNYFFQWLGWLAYPLLAIDLGGTYPWGWVALAGPICMYWLLVHVSGIPPLEAHMLALRGDAFRAYQARTSAFFPLPPRTTTGAVG